MSARASTYRRYPTKRRPNAVTATNIKSVPAPTPRLWWIESGDDDAPAWQPKPAEPSQAHDERTG